MSGAPRFRTRSAPVARWDRSTPRRHSPAPTPPRTAQSVPPSGGHPRVVAPERPGVRANRIRIPVLLRARRARPDRAKPGRRYRPTPAPRRGRYPRRRLWPLAPQPIHHPEHPGPHGSTSIRAPWCGEIVPAADSTPDRAGPRVRRHVAPRSAPPVRNHPRCARGAHPRGTTRSS